MNEGLTIRGRLDEIAATTGIHRLTSECCDPRGPHGSAYLRPLDEISIIIYCLFQMARVFHQKTEFLHSVTRFESRDSDKGTCRPHPTKDRRGMSPGHFIKVLSPACCAGSAVPVAREIPVPAGQARRRAFSVLRCRLVSEIRPGISAAQNTQKQPIGAELKP